MDPTEKDQQEEQPSVADQIAASLGATEDAPLEVASAAVTEEAPPAEVTEAVAAEKTPEQIAAEAAANPPDPAADEAAKAAKAVDDELKTLGITNEKSQARYRELANEAAKGRKAEEELATVRGTLDQQAQVFDHLDKQGVSGEQFGLMVAIAGDVNSGDPARQKRAYEQLMIQANELAKSLAIETPDYDPVAAHADLAREVEEGVIDRARAKEIAALRRERELSQQHQQTRDQQAATSDAVASAQSALTALGNELRQKDQHYDSKVAILTPIMKEALVGVHPSEWASRFARAYAALPAPAAATPPPVTRRADPNASGRPNGSAGAAVPKTSAEAVMMGLGFSTGE